MNECPAIAACPTLPPPQPRPALRLALVVALFWGLAVGWSAAAQELVAAVARVPGLPFYVAESEGYFAAEGLKLRIEDCTARRRCLKSLLDGEVNIAMVTETSIMLNSFASNGFSILATLCNASGDIKFVARKSAGILAPRDLSGKRIGTVFGSAAQYFLDSLLLFNGIDRRNVTIVNLTTSEAAAAIGAGKVDALVIFEPFAYQSIAALGSDAVVFPTGRISHSSFNIVIDRRLAGARDQDLGKMLRALKRAEDFIHQQPKKAQAILQKRAKLDQVYVERIWPDYDFRLGLDQTFLNDLESQARWAIREGLVKGTVVPNYLSFLYSTPLTRLLPAAVTIVE